MWRSALGQCGIAALLLGVAPASSPAGPVVFSAAGATPADIQATVDGFRNALGPLNPNVAGSFGSGRREINWDGVADAFSSPNNFPADFFNVNSPRGVVYSTPGDGFQVSAGPASGVPVRFGNLDSTYAAQFSTFSAPRLFTAVGSELITVDFFVPGTNTPATVSGFGAVFTDVGLAGFTSLLFFDAAGAFLGDFTAPVSPPAGLSFLGVTFDAGERVSQVVIISGSSPLGQGVRDNVAAGGLVDVVALDDFIYGEPTAAGVAVPEPATWALAAAAGLLGTTRRLRLRVRR